MAKVSIMRLQMGFVATMMLLDVLMGGVDHIVGAPNGRWDLSTDLQTWALSQTFLVGDNLVFQYDSNHNVYEVVKADYYLCRTQNAISIADTSPTRIQLTEVGNRYFICGRGTHCSQGMMVQIDVVAKSPSPPQTTTPSPPPPFIGVTARPPSSATTLKMMNASFMMGFKLFVMMLLSL